LNIKKDIEVNIMQNRNSTEKSILENESTLKLLISVYAKIKAQAEMAMSNMKIIHLGTILM